MPVTQDPELAVQTYVARAMLDGVTGDDLALVATQVYKNTHGKEPDGKEMFKLLRSLQS